MRFYLGSLTRYYADNGGVGDSHRETDPEVIAGAVSAWRHWLNKQLPHTLDWNESPTAPFDEAVVGDSDWGALWLLVAYSAPGRPEPPRHVPSDWRDNRFVRELANDDHEWPYPQILRPSLWLPGQHELLFQTRDLQEREIWIGSSAELGKHLGYLARHWEGALGHYPGLADGLRRMQAIVEPLIRRSSMFSLPLTLSAV
jgi:hypothetical protein